MGAKQQNRRSDSNLAADVLESSQASAPVESNDDAKAMLERWQAVEEAIAQGIPDRRGFVALVQQLDDYHVAELYEDEQARELMASTLGPRQQEKINAGFQEAVGAAATQPAAIMDILMADHLVRDELERMKESEAIVEGMRAEDDILDFAEKGEESHRIRTPAGGQKTVQVLGETSFALGLVWESPITLHMNVLAVENRAWSVDSGMMWTTVDGRYDGLYQFAISGALSGVGGEFEVYWDEGTGADYLARVLGGTVMGSPELQWQEPGPPQKA